jgi:hypothetical protein
MSHNDLVSNATSNNRYQERLLAFNTWRIYNVGRLKFLPDEA